MEEHYQTDRGRWHNNIETEKYLFVANMMLTFKARNASPGSRCLLNLIKLTEAVDKDVHEILQQSQPVPLTLSIKE